MAITYPRELPSQQFRLFNLKLENTDSMSRSIKGRVISVIEYEDPFWSLEAETIELDRPRRQKWEAWEESLRGGKSFVTHNVGHEWPLFYRETGIPQVISSAWNGKGVASAANAKSYTATGCPAGFKILEGDLVGLESGGRFFLMRVAEDRTANGSGTITVLTTAAVPTTLFPVGCTVVFYKPKVQMVIVPSTFECSTTTRPEPITFKAVQKL